MFSEVVVEVKVIVEAYLEDNNNNNRAHPFLEVKNPCLANLLHRIKVRLVFSEVKVLPQHSNLVVFSGVRLLEAPRYLEVNRKTQVLLEVNLKIHYLEAALHLHRAQPLANHRHLAIRHNNHKIPFLVAVKLQLLERLNSSKIKVRFLEGPNKIRVRPLARARRYLASLLLHPLMSLEDNNSLHKVQPHQFSAAEVNKTQIQPLDKVEVNLYLAETKIKHRLLASPQPLADNLIQYLASQQVRHHHPYSDNLNLHLASRQQVHLQFLANLWRAQRLLQVFLDNQANRPLEANPLHSLLSLSVNLPQPLHLLRYLVSRSQQQLPLRLLLHHQEELIHSPNKLRVLQQGCLARRLKTNWTPVFTA